jgi:hypothetical protein
VDIQGNDRIAATTASSLALKMAERIVIDVARSFNRCMGKINMIALPPTYCYIIFRATEELISFHSSTDPDQWSQDLEVLREASWHYGRRWQMGGKRLLVFPVRSFNLTCFNLARHLKSVDKATARLEPSPPLAFRSFEPLPNHPCLTTLFEEGEA